MRHQGLMDHYSKAYLLFGGIQGFYGKRFQDMLCSLRRFDKSEVAQQRMRIINFYEKYGEKVTYEAVKVSKKVISRWRKRDLTG